MRIINTALLTEFRGIVCEYCRIRASDHAAHLYHNGMGGGKAIDLRINLTGLCYLCHGRHHNGKEPTLATLLKIVSRREKVPAETITDRIRELQRLRKGEPLPDWMLTP